MNRQILPDIDLQSPAFPGGSAFAAMYDRRLMQLSDKGGASGMIGDRWSDICSDTLQTHPEDISKVDGEHHGIALDMVARLDDRPAIARIASRRGLQNPDFLVSGTSDEGATLQALDAKFSVDTAKPRQVSADVTRALLDLGPLLDGMVPSFDRTAHILDGAFLCPDFSMTRRLLETRRGQRRLVVEDAQVRLVAVNAPTFIAPLDHDRAIALFDAIDDLPIDVSESLLLSLYYFRLARAAVSCWVDATSPLLPYRDVVSPVIDDVVDDLREMSGSDGSGWSLVLRYDRRAEDVRRQRLLIEQAASLPLGGRRVRDRINTIAAAAGVEPPSVSKVRRILGGWFREQLRAEFGPLHPPVTDVAKVARDISEAARSRVLDVEERLDAVIFDLVSTPVIPEAS